MNGAISRPLWTLFIAFLIAPPGWAQDAPSAPSGGEDDYLTSHIEDFLNVAASPGDADDLRQLVVFSEALKNA